MRVIAIAGIDTGIGKTYVTGLLARYLKRQGVNVITAKIAQTGITGPAEDIQQHRRIMGMDWTAYDEKGLTCPYVFSFPASPHLAARLEHKSISLETVDVSLEELGRHFELILLEGAGGLAVPLQDHFTFLDYLTQRGYPCLLVTSPRLGSINHTLLSLEVLQARAIPVPGLLYNHGVMVAAEIAADTRQVFRSFYPALPLVEIPNRPDPEAAPEVDFSSIRIRSTTGG